MNSFMIIRRSLSVVALSALFVACSGNAVPLSGSSSAALGGAPVVSTGQASTFSAGSAPSQILYVADYKTLNVSGYSIPGYKLFCTTPGKINGTPLGMATDATGKLYVVGQVVSNRTGTITVFAPNCGKRLAVINDPYGEALTIALHGSTWYVTNAWNVDPNNPLGNVAVCSLAGCKSVLQTPPNHKFKADGLGEMFGVAVDAAGNVYTSGYLNSRKGFTETEIVKFPGGKMPGNYVKGATCCNDAPEFSIDNQGNLVELLVTEGPLAVISGCPTACHTNGPFALVRAKNPNFFMGALDQSNRKYYISNIAYGEVDIYHYLGTSGIKYRGKLNVGAASAPSGIALYPPPAP